MSITEEVALHGMRFHARIGILPHEQEYAQPLVVDIAVQRAPAEPGADVLDYRRLHEIVQARVLAAPIAYLETAAHDIARAALAEHGVLRARVSLRKPHVALPGPLDAATVTVEHAAGS